MDNQTYIKTRDKLLSRICPYFRVVSRGELVSVGQDSVNIGGIVLKTSPLIAAQIDEFIGVTRKQVKAVDSSFGVQGASNFRNYMSLARSIKETDSLALVADPKERAIKAVIPVKASVIAPSAFFDFLEMFMNDNGYTPDAVESDEDGTGLVVRLHPDTEHYTELTKDDRIIDNGLWFSWNPGEIEGGNYYVRQVCSNGQTAMAKHNLAHTYTLDEKRIRELLAVTEDEDFMKTKIGDFVTSAKVAMLTDASVREVGKANNLLQRVGVQEKTCEELAPISQLEDDYSKAGYSVNASVETGMRSNIKMWTLYNSITEYASHTTDWNENDSRRTSLMMRITKLLLAKRDIKEYINIYK